MKRCLAIAVMLSLAGCSCFDRAYDDYCQHSIKCDAGSAGGGFGGGTGTGGGSGGSGGGGEPHKLTVKTTSELAGTCVKGGLVLDVATTSPVSVTLDGTGQVDTFSNDVCDQPSTDFSIPSGSTTADFYFRTSYFGWLTLMASSQTPDVMVNPVEPFLSTAYLKFVKPEAHVTGPGMSCTSADQLKVEARDINANPATAANDATVTYSSDNNDSLFGGGSAMCLVHSYSFVFFAGQQTASAFAQSTLTTPGLFEGISAMGNPDGGLTDTASMSVYASCYPFSHACDTATDCCVGADGGSDCISLVCQ